MTFSVNKFLSAAPIIRPPKFFSRSICSMTCVEIIYILTEVGFVFGRDFINGMEFLSEVHGVPFNSYELLQMM